MRWFGNIARFLGFTLLGGLMMVINLTIAIEWALNSEAVSPILQALCKSRVDADVTVRNAEFSIFSSFPKAEVRLNGLRVVSHSLGKSSVLIDGAQLAVGIDAHSVISRVVEIPYITLLHPKVNIEIVNDSVNNFNILKKTPRHHEHFDVEIGDFKLENAQISMLALPWSRERYHATVDMRLALNKLPLIDLSDCDVSMRGINLSIAAKVNPRESDPMINTHIKADINAAALPPQIAKLLDGNYSGLFNLNLAARFRPSYFSGLGFRKIKASGTLEVDNPMVFIPSIETQISGSRLALQLGDGTPRLSKATSPLTAKLEIDSAQLAVGKFGLKLSHIDLRASSPDSLKIVEGEKIAPILANLTGSDIDVTLTNGARVLARKAKVGAKMNGSAPTITARADCGEFSFIHDNARVDIYGAHANISTHPDTAVIDHGATIVQAIDSTTSVVQVRMSPGVSEMVHNWTTSGDLVADSGQVNLRHLRLPTTLGPMALSFSPAGADIKSLSMKCGDTDMSIRGQVSADRSGTFSADLDIDGKLVDITQIQKALQNDSLMPPVSPKIPGLTPPHHHMIEVVIYHPEKTSTLVPANIDADINFHYDKAICGSVMLTDLMGNINAHHGTLALNGAKASTPYGTLSADANYRALTADNISYEITTRVSGIDLADLHSFMPMSQVLDPYIRDLGGTIDAALHFNGSLTPDMRLDPKTFEAQMNVSCPELSFTCSPTLHRVERWLLFKGRQPDRIKGIDVNVSIANENITLWPTNISFDRYHLIVMGNGDFNGNYKCHVDVNKSIVPWKFGVDIAGNVDSRPSISFGGHKFQLKSSKKRHHSFNLFDMLNEIIMRI